MVLLPPVDGGGRGLTTMVKAMVGYTVECQRAKYKHWHVIGTHTETDIEFRRALRDGSVQWLGKVIEPEFMF